jgi:predicted nucleic acid-binding protein
MNSEFILDSYAWIEYFNGSLQGAKVKEMLATKRALTPSIVIAELAFRYADWSEWKQMLAFIQANTEITGLNYQTANYAGQIKQAIRERLKNNFGLADAIILATAKEHRAKIVTGDQHFKEMPETIFLE